jgi:hypothetical protein
MNTKVIQIQEAVNVHHNSSKTETMGGTAAANETTACPPDDNKIK